MEKFVKNLVEEHRNLYARIKRAEKFLASDEATKNLDLAEYSMLYAQIEAMKAYCGILLNRLNYYHIAVANIDGKLDYYEKVS